MAKNENYLNSGIGKKQKVHLVFCLTLIPFDLPILVMWITESTLIFFDFHLHLGDLAHG